MTEVVRGPGSLGLSQLLSDEGMEFTPPSRALRGIDWQVAAARPGGSVHSIADILAHMRFWQRRLLDMVSGGPGAPVPHAQVGWPGVDEENWQGLVDEYLSGFEELRAIAASEPLLERPVREGHRNSVGYQVMSHFAHEAHHLGQIILLRRMLGAWPPPGGGDTW